MKFIVMRNEPCEVFAAAPATLDVLTASVRATLTERFGETVATGEIGELYGFPLVPDPSLPPGFVHMRPSIWPPRCCPTAGLTAGGIHNTDCADRPKED